MAMEKGILVFGLLVLIMGTVVVAASVDGPVDGSVTAEGPIHSEAFVETDQYIKYDPIKRGDRDPGCSKKHPKECGPPIPANPYQRGCEPSQRCRTGFKRLF